MENSSADYQTKETIWLLNAWVNRLQNFLKDFNYVLKKRKISADYQTKKTTCSTDCKTFSKNFYCCF